MPLPHRPCTPAAGQGQRDHARWYLLLRGGRKQNALWRQLPSVSDTFRAVKAASSRVARPGVPLPEAVVSPAAFGAPLAPPPSTFLCSSDAAASASSTRLTTTSRAGTTAADTATILWMSRATEESGASARSPSPTSSSGGLPRHKAMLELGRHVQLIVHRLPENKYDHLPSARRGQSASLA
eukprot:scaffold53_cov362-Prasinococcus_capsulatus_cf.AAC.2